MVTVDSQVFSDLERLSAEHREIDVRPRRWDRVMRRFYTLHRRVGCESWQGYWKQDLIAYPGSAPHILEYVRSWPLTREVLRDFKELEETVGRLYPNVSILLAETLMTAPVPNDLLLWRDLFVFSNAVFRRSVPSPTNQRVASAWLVSAWKYANDTQVLALMRTVDENTSAASPVRAQALPLAVGAGQSVSEWVAAKPGLSWDTALTAEYLRSLSEGEAKAVGVALSLAQPYERLMPNRFMIAARALPLLNVLGRSGQPKFPRAVERWIAKLDKNPARLRDERVFTILRLWLP